MANLSFFNASSNTNTKQAKCVAGALYGSMYGSMYGSIYGSIYGLSRSSLDRALYTSWKKTGRKETNLTP